MKEKTKEYDNYQIGVVADNNVNIHQIRANNWKISVNGLIFYDGKKEIAWFIDWAWWKQV